MSDVTRILDRVQQGEAGAAEELLPLVYDELRKLAAENPLEADAFFEKGAESGAATVLLPVTEKPGDRVGRYKLLQQIGEGGCGVVYMAEQEEPVRRRVALKVIKLGMDTGSVIARFEAERQALALMDHPNIAKVLDAGATETGQPYFVMELVRGIKITDYCDQNNLSTRERLDLFIQVCHAIQHAHQKGIIHRDIKPSNILVSLQDGAPVPVVIDFGIATGSFDRTAKVWTAATTDQVVTWGREEDAANERLTALRREQEAVAEGERKLRTQDPGVIRQWLVLAPMPFAGEDGALALRQEQIPHEADLRARAGERVQVGQAEWLWAAVQLEDYLLDLNQLLEGEMTAYVVGYAVCYILSETTQRGLLMHVGSDDDAKAYLNGKEIYRREERRTYVPDQDVVSGVELKTGLNVLVFKVVNRDGDWQGSIRFTDAAGQPVKGIRVTLDPQSKGSP